MIESEETGCEEGLVLKDDMSSEANPKIELCASSEELNLVGDGGSSHTEDPTEIIKEDDGVEKEKVLDDGVNTKASISIEPDIIPQTDNVACEMELDMPQDSEAATEKLIEAVSSEASPSSEIHISGEPDSIGSKVEPGIPSVSEGMDTLIEGVSSEANTSGEIHISGETDSIASKLDPGRASVSAVATEKLIDGVCSEANPFNETYLSGETESDVPKAGPCLSSVSEVATESLIDGVSSMAKPSNEPGLSVEIDNVVCKVDPDMPCDSKVATRKLTDAVSSKVTPSSEPHIRAETDKGVSELEPNLPGDSEAATEKLIDGMSSDANPSSEPHISAEIDNAVCEMVPDVPCDREVAAEKLIHGVSGEANPSNEPHISAETDTVDCKVEPDNKPHVSGVATERTIEGLNVKENSLNEAHMSDETDNVVSKVEPNMLQDNVVSESDDDDDDDADHKKGESMNSEMSSKSKLFLSTDIDGKVQKPKFYVGRKAGRKTVDPKTTFLLDPGAAEDDDSGTEEERVAFIKEVENLYREKNLEFKAPKFYREELNLLKLWRAVVKLGGYEKVTSCKLWRQVGETFNPPKTCTTVSWTFRIFYEKALLEFEKDRLGGGELTPPADPTRVETQVQVDGSQTLGSGRTLRDAAARAMQGWHSQRLLGNGEVGNATTKDKHLSPMPKSDKQLRSSGLLKRKKPSHVDAIHGADMKSMKPRMDTMIFDVGPPSDWVKINVKRFSDCFEVYALVPGLLREEVHVQSDPAGRLIISGQPTQLDNPWGVTPFKKVVSLPTRIDPHQTSAVVTLNGQLYVRVPFEQPHF